MLSMYRRFISRGLAALVLTLAAATTAMAQVPRTLNYQGYLTSPGGTPINGVATLIASIWDQPSGGTQLASNTFASVAVTNGVFNVALDVSSVTFTGPTYLQIIINGETLSPRQPISASAYAIRAASSDAFAIECTRQFGSFVNVPANTYGFGVSAVCPTGYTATGMGIEAAANVVVADSVISNGSATIFTYNLGSTAQSTRAWVQCCRVPAREN
ncbi:MAG: hypothetical protein KIS89_07020 [Dokdonella sp.]|uniref:hypothetical protein n=1 Tax=Dokdonella sp. TaxID=2291710 RepID=UPI0027B9313F|nr:hypothetical protein [Dokdonella sp.]MCW5578376.1 hypothetical protein [Dokdonella sp.]